MDMPPKRSNIATIIELSRQLGKVPCEVNDYPGFIANRIPMPMINEAIYSLFEGGWRGDRHGHETGHGSPDGPFSWQIS